LTKHEDGKYYYTPISLQLVAKKIPRKRLEAIRESAGILLATYGMCAKGFDEPRLKLGVDLTPRSEVEQIHGRILREVPGSKMPIWLTVRDTMSYRLLFSFAKRIGGYLNSNGRIYHWLDDGDLIECHEEEIIAEARDRSVELKSCRIETRSDGRNTLLTERRARQLKMQREKDTVTQIRSRRRA
jgi:hypothetical protein